MKNLFEINQEEKNRILGLHESATKNHYLISEQNSQQIIDSVKDSSIWTKYFGNNWREVTSASNQFSASINVSELQNIIVDIKINQDNTSGNLSFNYPNITGQDDTSDVKSRAGTWSYNNGNFTGDIDGQSFSKKTMQESVYHLLKFFYPNSMQYYSRKADLSIPQSTTPQSNKGTFTWVQAVAKWPCLSKQKDKTVYNNGSYDYVKYDWEGMPFYAFLGDGHLFQPSTNSFTGKYLGKDVPCDASTKEDEVLAKREPTTPKYYKEITDLQRKVGEKDDGFLGPKTLKAIMDKLSQ
jgi:hypothetical protein